MTSIIIFDHVGEKSGMDRYNSHLISACSMSGKNVSLVSNYQHPNSAGLNFPKTKRLLLKFLFELLKFLLSNWRSGRSAKFIVHKFDSSLLFFSLFMCLRSFGEVIIICHDIVPFGKSRSKFVDNVVFRLAQSIVVHNDYSRSTLCKLYSRLSASKIFKIAHPVHQDFPKTDEDSTVQSKGCFSLGLFGTVKKTKGFIEFLELLMLTDFSGELRIFGADKEGKMKSCLQYNAENIKFKVSSHFRFVSDEEYYYQMSEVDCVVLPYTEIFQSGILLEALALGKVVVVSDIEGFKEIISNGVNGFIYELSNEKSLENVLRDVETLLLDPKLSFQFKERIYDYLSREHSTDAIRGKWQEVLS